MRTNSPQRVAMFANPISGSGRGAAVARAVERELRRDGVEVVPHLARPREAPFGADGFDALVVVGGDGTLRDVVRWAMSSAPATVGQTFLSVPERTPGLQVPILLVPMGTANLMGQCLGLPWSHGANLDALADALRAGHTAQLDVAATDDDLVLMVLGVGIDAAIVRALHLVRSGPISKASYLLPSLRAAMEYDYPPLTVCVDGSAIWADRPAMVFVGNVSQYGTGFPVCPLARPDDGLLDVCIVPADSLEETVGWFLLAAGGAHVGCEGVLYARGSRIVIDAPRSLPVQIDGEAAGFSPVSVSMTRMKLPMVVASTISFPSATMPRPHMP
jgi:diacylglycerol kinase (ATP)